MQTIIEPTINTDILVSAPVTINIPFAVLLAAIEALPDPQKWLIYQTLSAKFTAHSAEAKAISRLPDQDDPSKWITSIEEDEPIDEQALNAWLEKKGYQKANV